MSVPARRVVLAELDKLVTLPAVRGTLGATVAGAAVLAVALAGGRAGGTASAALTGSIPVVQAGLIALGVLPVAHEYAGAQARTALIAVPDRTAWVLGKSVAAALMIAVAAALAVAAGAFAAALSGPWGQDLPPERLAGAWLYLGVIGPLAHAVALVLRQLVPSLAAALAGVTVVSPALAAISPHARWLADRAAAQLYSPTDAVLTPVTGAVVAAAWIALLGGCGAIRLVRRDA